MPASPAALSRAVHHSVAFLNDLHVAPVGASASYASLIARLGRPLPEHGAPAAQVIDELVADVEGGIMGSAGGRFFGWVIGGGLESALAADLLTAAWDQNAALYSCAPAAAVVEEVAAGWIKSLLELPSSASFALTTGCQMAHVTCLAAARGAILSRRGWDVETLGLAGSPGVTILTGAQAHGSILRAASLLGVGRGSVLALPLDEGDRLRPEVLEAALAERRGEPVILVLQAGDLNIAAFDDFSTLIPIARAAGAWVHVDGAFGLWARVSKQRRCLLNGVEMADSWATDAHKWLNVPYDCGMAIIADRDAHRGAMSLRASYLTHDETARDQIDWNPEWSRRARGFPIYAALREMGRQGLSHLIDRCCGHAERLTAGIAAIEGAELLWTPTLNQGLVRFLDPRPDACQEDHDLWTDRVIAQIALSGEAFFGGTTWRGRRAMRISVCNWRTTQADVERTIMAARKAMSDLTGKASLFKLHM